MFWDIILAALASMILGFIWYGPLFGKQWLRLMKVTPKQVAAAKKKGMPASMYFWMILSSIVTATVLSVLVPATAWAAVKTASVVWLGFVAAIMINSVLYEGKTWKLYILNVGYYLVSFVIQAFIFAGMN